MYVYKAAQPALLYLVPCCLISSYSVSIYLGEFKSVFWVYNEESQEIKDLTGDVPETAEESKNK